MINVGELVNSVFRELQKEHPEYTVIWLAEKMCCGRRNIYNIFKRSYLDTDVLTRLSIVLHHNLFDDLRKKLDEELRNEQRQGNAFGFISAIQPFFAQRGLWCAEVIPGEFDENGEPKIALRQFPREELIRKCEEIDKMLRLA
jgi:hypothetical protein